MQQLHITAQWGVMLRHAVSISVSIIITQVFQLFIRHVCKLGLQLLDLLVQQWRRLLLRDDELSDGHNQRRALNFQFWVPKAFYFLRLLPEVVDLIFDYFGRQREALQPFELLHLFLALNVAALTQQHVLLWHFSRPA